MMLVLNATMNRRNRTMKKILAITAIAAGLMFSSPDSAQASGISINFGNFGYHSGYHKGHNNSYYNKRYVSAYPYYRNYAPSYYGYYNKNDRKKYYKNKQRNSRNSNYYGWRR